MRVRIHVLSVSYNIDCSVTWQPVVMEETLNGEIPVSIMANRETIVVIQVKSNNNNNKGMEIE